MNFEEIKQKADQEWRRFNRLERPRILIGAATCGRAAGALEIWEKFKQELGSRSIQADFVEVGDLGMCFAEPCIEIGVPGGRRVLYGSVEEKTVPALVEDFIVKGDPRPDLALCTFGDMRIEGIPAFEDLPMIRKQVRVVLRNSGIIDPANIDHYIARGGYSGLVRCLRMKPEEVIEEVKASGLRGRGGAGFPTGVKWGLARNAKGDAKYIICNADEGDPGAFMDRAVLEGDPHAVLEGLIIGGLRHRRTLRLCLCPRRVSPRHRAAGAGHRADEGIRLPGREHPGVRFLRVRQDQAGCRGLCVRRRDGPHGLHRRPKGNAETPASLPGPVGTARASPPTSTTWRPSPMFRRS